VDEDELEGRWEAAVEDGSPEAMERWAAAGDEAVRYLKDVLESGVPITRGAGGMAMRDVIDNTTEAVARLASAAPQAFLDAFNQPQWWSHPLVVEGFGTMDRPEVVGPLLAALRSDDWGRRASAARCLTGHAGDERVRAELARVQEHDPHQLVRYWAEHALQSGQ
jgi:HEAT repeat protein